MMTISSQATTNTTNHQHVQQQMSKITWLLSRCRRRLLCGEDATELIRQVEDLIQEFEKDITRIVHDVNTSNDLQQEGEQKQQKYNKQDGAHLMALESYKLQLGSFWAMNSGVQLRTYPSSPKYHDNPSSTSPDNQQVQSSYSSEIKTASPPSSPTSVVPVGSTAAGSEKDVLVVTRFFKRLRLPTI